MSGKAGQRRRRALNSYMAEVSGDLSVSGELRRHNTAHGDSWRVDHSGWSVNENVVCSEDRPSLYTAEHRNLAYAKA